MAVGKPIRGFDSLIFRMMKNKCPQRKCVLSCNHVGPHKNRQPEDFRREQREGPKKRYARVKDMRLPTYPQTKQNFKTKLEFQTEISLNDIESELLNNLSWDELFDFIVRLEKNMGEWDFTNCLIKHFKRLNKEQKKELKELGLIR